MNNSWAAQETPEPQHDDGAEKAKEMEASLVRRIEAVQRLQESQEWSTLKIEVFDGLTARLERELREEARKNDPNVLKLNRLTGQLEWSEKFSDLKKFENSLRVELMRIRTMLYGRTE